MNQKITTELKDFLQELGYPFDSISGLLDSGMMDKKFTRISSTR